MNRIKCIREYNVPRETVTPEVSRVFQLILISLQNLEKKLGEIEPVDLNPILARLENLERMRPERAVQERRVTPAPPAETERTYVHTLE